MQRWGSPHACCSNRLVDKNSQCLCIQHLSYIDHDRFRTTCLQLHHLQPSPLISRTALPSHSPPRLLFMLPEFSAPHLAMLWCMTTPINTVRTCHPHFGQSCLSNIKLIKLTTHLLYQELLKQPSACPAFV